MTSNSRSRKSTSRMGAARATAAKRTARGAATRSRARKSDGASRGRRGNDILSLLKQDHATVDKMFRSYDRMKGGDERKQALKERIIEELKVHAQAEEELFYPALRERAYDKGAELLDEAHVEHDTFKWLIAALEGETGGEDATDARVKVLGEYVKHHVKEEEGEIFKLARKADLDLVQLGREFDARKRAIKGETADEEMPEMAGGAMQGNRGGDRVVERSAR